MHEVMTSSMQRALRRGSALGMLLAALALGAGAAIAPVDDPALVARARAEGALSYYAGLSEVQLTLVSARFKATYPGIDIQTLRASPLTLLSRVVAEQNAGHYSADVIDDAVLEIDQLKRSGMLAQYRLPERNDFLPGTVDPDGYWAAIFL